MRAALIASALIGVAEAGNWAVIAAGSNGYYNYRHQADACHAYQVMRSKGIPEDNIILMMYDDIANHTDNPFPGKLYNKPDPRGPGKDVYAGCKIDYSGDDVNPETFTNVLLGNGTGKVLKSTEEDSVFVYFVDHGAPGLIMFPDSELHVKDLQKTLKSMHTHKMFKKLVFYLETCYSGSMFDGMKVPGVYALSAANQTQNSWGAYCGKEAEVNGTSIGLCLSDAFSAAWLEDAEGDMENETLGEQFELVKAKTPRSVVMQWGDVSLANESIASIFGSKGSVALTPVSASASRRDWNGRNHDMEYLLYEYQNAASSFSRVGIGKKMELEMHRQNLVEQMHRRVAEIAYPDSEMGQKMLRERTEQPGRRDCELEAREAMRKHCSAHFDPQSGFTLWFHQIFVNLCYDTWAIGLNLSVRGAIEVACGELAQSTIEV